MIEYLKILELFYSNSKWSINGDDYSGIVWLSEDLKPTKEEMDAKWTECLDMMSKNNCKQKAKLLIASTDWAVLPDVGLVNQADYTTYRAALRALIINPVADPVWPTEPTPEWG